MCTHVLSVKMASSPTFYEYIVIGCGGIGSGTVYWLSKRSDSVLGLEQFQLGHVNGGSQDHSRIIRLAYHDDCYTRLTPDCYKTWQNVESESGIQLVWKTGGVQFARKGEGDYIIDKFTAAMDKNNIRYERLDNKQIMSRFPQFTLGPDFTGLYQKDGGLVDAALGNAVHIQLARGNGATIIDNCPVTRLSRANDGNVVVHTTKGLFKCRKVIVTAGAWLNTVLGTIGVHIPVTVTQEQVTYFATPHMKEFTKNTCPTWVYHTPKCDFYGLPIHGSSGTKASIDIGGHPVTATTRTFTPDKDKLRMYLDIVNQICPKFNGPELETKTCLYTLTPDRHFVVDTCAHKGWSDVIVCCGAGHAYKFASLLGKILSELSVDGKTPYDISHFNITRDAIQDPNFRHSFYMGGGVLAKM